MSHNFTALLTSPLPFVRHAAPQDPRLALVTLACAVLAILFLLFPRRLFQPRLISRTALRALRIGGPIPSHIAFIMDGNRRWARRLGLPAHAGHPQGGDKLLHSLQWCLDAGVRTVTVYAFSLENFKRAAVEVEEIMTLAERTFLSLSDRTQFIHANRVRVRVWGDLGHVPPSLRRIFATVMADTAHYEDALTLNICFAYTARHDIASAVRDTAALCRTKSLSPDQISPELIEASLSSGYAKGASPNATFPDLLVRTSGETRLSDFLLWECSDAVLSFCPTLWPDFSAWDLIAVILDYQRTIRIRDAQAERLGMKQYAGVAHRRPSNFVRDTLVDVREQHLSYISSMCDERILT